MLPSLPDDYYLDNVRTLFDHVESVYGDILDADYLDFLNRFKRLPDDAQKLLIRLLNRTGEHFRLSKLNYPEIASISIAVNELEERDFIQLNPDLEPETILSLFNKAELIKQHPESDALKKLNRVELDNYLLNEENEVFFDSLTTIDHFIKPSHKDTYQLIQMIFFGNLNQSMTDFVLRDLGLYQFENYSIDANNRPYHNTEEIDQHWLLYQLDGIIQLCDIDNINTLLDCFKRIPECSDQQSALYRKSQRLKFDIARQFERLGELKQAMALYQQCQLAPSRERRARIHHQQGELQQAIDLCLAITDAPMDESENQFAIEFAARLVRQNKLDPLSGLSGISKYQPETIELELEQQTSVEQAVVDYYKNRAYFLENSLFNGVLGLLIWEAIFAPVNGAFYNPFQYRPADFYAQDFVEKRQGILGPMWSSIPDNEAIWQRVSRCWQGKQGLANPLVDWHSLSLDIIELALQRIPHPHWLAIFNRILFDLRNNRSGFPDLIVFPADGDYLLVEVKGPGDTLQKNQQRWMQYFSEHDIPHMLARVSWSEA